MDEQSVMGRYLSKSYRLILYITPGVSLVASLVFFLGKAVGWYPTVSWLSLILFACLNILYALVTVFFLLRAYDNRGYVKPAYLTGGKVIFGFFLLVQWNCISYLIPSMDFWAYLPLFVLLGAALLDMKFVLIESALLIVSAGISWILRPGVLLPAYDPASPGAFSSALMMRLVCFFLSVGTIAFVTRMCSTVLLHEMETVTDYDPLTKLFNRRPLDGILEKAQAEVVKGRPHSLAVFDIDDFKRINDTYGHAYGDKVLRKMAKLLAEAAKKNGVAFRWGGEEFLLLLSTDTAEAAEVCESVVRDFSEVTFSPMPDVELHVTVTAGLAPMRPNTAYKQTLSEADSYLYEGKRMGKNRVVSPRK